MEFSYVEAQNLETNLMEEYPVHYKCWMICGWLKYVNCC